MRLVLSSLDEERRLPYYGRLLFPFSLDNLK